MALDLTALTAYVEENRADLITKPITGSRTFDYFDIRQGIKSGEKIPILDSTVPAQAGSACGFTSSGTTTVSQTTLNTTSIKVQEAICLQDLEAYFTQKYLPAGSNPEDTALEQEIVNRKLARIAQKVGQMVWQGKTTYTNDTYLKQMNGFIAQIDTAGTAIAATQQADITTATVRGIFEDIIYVKMPIAIQGENPVVFCGVDTMRLLLLKFMQDNMYHIVPAAGDYSANEFMYPGTNVKVIGLNELNANNAVDSGGTLPVAVQDRIFAGDMKNFVAGFDAINDKQNFKVWYSEDNFQLRFHLRFNIGVVNHFVDQIVQYKNL